MIYITFSQNAERDLALAVRYAFYIAIAIYIYNIESSRPIILYK